MGSLGALGIGLSVVFVGFVLVLVGELYYLIFWKKRHNLAHRIHETALLQSEEVDEEAGFVQEQFNVIANRHQSFRTESKLFQSDAAESIGGTHYLMGPPRFLFTIREETKEELESETAARSRTASLDFAVIQQFSEPGTPYETPFATPPSSPSMFSTPPTTPSHSSPCSSSQAGIRALAREPPMHCTIFIPSSPQQQNFGRGRRIQATSRTTMMMLMLNSSPGSPPGGLSPAASPNTAAYSTPPTHLYSPFRRIL